MIYPAMASGRLESAIDFAPRGRGKKGGIASLGVDRQLRGQHIGRGASKRQRDHRAERGLRGHSREDKII